MTYLAIFAAGFFAGIGATVGAIVLMIAWQEAKIDAARGDWE